MSPPPPPPPPQCEVDEWYTTGAGRTEVSPQPPPSRTAAKLIPTIPPPTLSLFHHHSLRRCLWFCNAETWVLWVVLLLLLLFMSYLIQSNHAETSIHLPFRPYFTTAMTSGGFSSGETRGLTSQIDVHKGSRLGSGEQKLKPYRHDSHSLSPWSYY